jgi:nucleoside-diphosphate-sugar epimerase
MAGRVMVTGGAGFVGSTVIDELLSRGYAINALVNRHPIRKAGVDSFEGGLFNGHALDRAMAGCSAVIHLVGIIMERPGKGITFDRIHRQGTQSVVDAAIRNGVKRYLHMSALGTRPGAVSNYHKTKFAAEQYVRNSGLDWTIFRPSFIHGPRGEFMQMVSRWARFRSPPFLFMPYFGRGPIGRGGAGKLQPVYVNDVARAFVDALTNPKSIGEVYLLGGPEEYTWPQLHRTSSTAIIGRRRAVLALPAWYAKFLTHIVPQRLLPFNRDQVIMSQEDNTADISKFVDHFGWKPRSFEQTLQGYAAQL